CGCRAGAPAVFHAQLIGAYAEFGGAIEIWIERQPKFLPGGQPRLTIRMVVLQIGDAQLAMAAVILTVAMFVAFGAFEERQNRLIVPTGRSFGSPVVVVPVLAPDIQQTVD